MGDPTGQSADGLHLLRLMQLLLGHPTASDVGHHDNGSRVGPGGVGERIGGKDRPELGAVFPPKSDVQLLFIPFLPPRQILSYRSSHILVHKGQYVTPQHFRGRVPEHIREHQIDVGRFPLSIEHPDTFVSRFHDRPVALFAGSDDLIGPLLFVMSSTSVMR